MVLTFKDGNPAISYIIWKLRHDCQNEVPVLQGDFEGPASWQKLYDLSIMMEKKEYKSCYHHLLTLQKCWHINAKKKR